MNPDDVTLCIVSFRRLDALTRTLNDWLNSFPFNDILILANDPSVDYTHVKDAFRGLNIKTTWRFPWETGSIAWCWNQCMRYTFYTRRWCMMSQDDVAIRQGWPELITDDYDTYIAPAGDTIQLQSIEGFRKVGWFDERFRAIGGPEADYLLRCLQENPDRLSAHDEHVWQLRHNDVGLGELWRPSPREGEVAATRAEYNVPFADAECFARWEQKWGEHVDSLFINRHYDTARRPGWEEIDWYPAYTRRLKEMGRL